MPDFPTPDDALGYVLDGWPVVQVDRHSKRVSHNGWSSTANPITDPAVIRRLGPLVWPGCAPGGHNLGGVLGRGPRARYALDVDPTEGSEETIARWAKQGRTLPPTRTHATPRDGRHPIILGPPGISSRKLGPGVFLRGAGWYVVLPPSRLADGRGWSVFDDRPEVWAPDWLLEWLTSHSPRLPNGGAVFDTSLVPERTYAIPPMVERFLDQGPRDDDVSGQVWWFLRNCLEWGMTAGEALWITTGWYRPAKVKYGHRVDVEVRRILAKLAPLHQHPGVPCDHAGCPHRPVWQRGGAR